jgi:polyhydroxyalkanoate synthase subunit PhaC
LQDLASLGKKEAESLALGIQRYHSAIVKEKKFNGTVVYKKHSAYLYSYGSEGIPALVIPSLINKPHILDLNPNKSFMLELKSNGLNPYLLDWGNPSNIEENFGLEDYINEILIPSIEHIASIYGKVALIGYCMGGFIATAVACIRPDLINKLVTIATPWDFQHWKKPSLNFLQTYSVYTESIPANIIQQLFYFAAPYDVNRKYQRFSNGELNEEDFIEIENWVNDGVDMSKKVFEECFEKIVNQNILYNNKWSINNCIINPANTNLPIMSAVFRKDSIVPLKSALSFAEQCTNVNLLQLDSGHIGAIINSKYQLAQNICKWIKS